MASTLKHLRSSTTNKRPTASGLADGQIAINTASGTPALFFKDNADNIVKVGPVHVGATAPNVSPAGSVGNSTGELWVDDSSTTKGLKYYSGTAFVNLTPSGTTSEAGLVELATNAETQTGSDAVRAVTPAGLQSKVSDSTSTTSSTTIASATAVKSAYDLANAALPKTGGTVTGEIVISPSGSLAFEGSTDDSFETRIVVTNPTADRTITLPNITGTVITTGDTGTVTSTMIVDGTIVNADINASAAIAPSKLGSGALPNGVTVSSTNIVNGTIVNADVNASAAIAGSKISPDFAGQNVVTTGSITGASLIPSSVTVPTNGVYLPAANNVAISTNSTGRLSIDANGRLLVGVSSTSSSCNAVFQGSSGGTVFGVLKASATSTTPTSTQTLGRLDFTDSGHSAASTIAGLRDGGTWTSGVSQPSALTFSVTADGASSPTEAIRINNAGELLVGYTSDNGAYKLQVNSQIFATSATIATSDGRYKENVATLDGCVDLVKALRPVSFDWKHQEPITRIDEDGETIVVREAHNFPDGTQVGFIAQEVETVFADKPWLGSVIKQNVRPAVTDNDGNELAPEEEFLGIAEGNLVAVLTSALKDAIGEIESLKARIAALEAN